MRTFALSAVLGMLLVENLLAQSPNAHRLTAVPIQQVTMDDAFWSPKLKVWREVTIPDCLAKFEKDGALMNFDKIRDGRGGEHGGPPWYDGLIYEMIRAAADFLMAKRDAALEARLDGYIARIAAAAAKDPNGYLNTYTQLKEPTHRWGLAGGNDNWQHDVYNAGAMIEAGVHYYRATGKKQLLCVAVRLANHMAEVMGPPPRANVVPGHSIGEEALVKLELLFREQPELAGRLGVPVVPGRYLKLAEFFIENRGNHQGRTSYGPYGQDHKPVLQQETIEGHAVRATLLCTGLAAAADVNGRQDYLAAATRLWNNMVERRMYVIGGLGAVAGHEGFGPDYALPNNGYLETCAAIGAAFFHHRMNLALGHARYVDELERALYNGTLSGVSLRGDTYFYENPLEAGANRTRWAWHGCPCCPPMFLKIVAALPGYVYAQDQDGVYVNLYAGSRATLRLRGVGVSLRQTTRYPWDGEVRLAVEPQREAEFAVCLRLPGWCDAARLRVNGEPVPQLEKVRGYARVRRTWRRGDVVELSLPMPVVQVHAHPKVEADVGRAAIQRGPIVYCLEGGDNGGFVRNLAIPPDTTMRAEHRPDLLGGVTVVRGRAMAVQQAAWPETLYLPAARAPGVSRVEFTAIPYYANANRTPSEMRVWIAETASRAEALPPPAKASIHVQADKVLGDVSRLWTGACIEDVNHEIYGGLYSQMIFGESFQEPAPPPTVKDFTAYGGRWEVANGVVHVRGEDGPKLVSSHAAFRDGSVGAELFFPAKAGGNAALVVRTSDPDVGADRFIGYEVALDPVRQMLRLGRHRNNFEAIRDVPCEVPIGRWVAMEVRLSGSILEARVDGRSVLRHDDGQAALPAGNVALRPWHCEVKYRNVWIATEGRTERLALVAQQTAPEVSSMWRPVRRGSAAGRFALVSERPFVGERSQRIAFDSGEGQWGVENQSLNRWGMRFVAGKPYEGYVWVRAEKPATLYASLESRDGRRVYAETPLSVSQAAPAAGQWQRIGFTLVPNADEQAGRFTLTLRQPGDVVLGHAFLQPGPWGRFKGLPVRRDVAEALIDQGITVLRYGGSMVNAPGYRWKNMIGPRDRRPSYPGTWYRHSTNGWGIVDFMNFCEAAGFEYIPAFNMGESPQDMADFLEYAKGPVTSPWGQRRAADGHPEPYRLKYIELGNEERVDEKYAMQFAALAKALWASDPAITLVVGDFVYDRRIDDPMKVTGAASGITNLEGQRQILKLTKQHGREVWFDLHVGTEFPERRNNSLEGALSFADALEKMAEGAKHRVVVFELNAANHAQKRALANALAINALHRDGRMPIVTSANCLQPDGQNDNAWDQGLLFLTPSQVWLQPPGYVTQMMARNYLPKRVACDVAGEGVWLDAVASRSDDGRALVIQAVNPGSDPVTASIALAGFAPKQATASVTELAQSWDAVNTAADPRRVVPQHRPWPHAIADGKTTFRFAPSSFTVLRFE